MELANKLNSLAAAEPCCEWQPLLLDIASEAGRNLLDGLFRDGRVANVHDTLISQLQDLVRVSDPSRTFNDAQIQEAIEALLNGKPLVEYGTWVFYPWSGQLVHVLPRAQFRRLRSDRNRNKITTEEQQRLQTVTIGIVGLSVGASVALTMALEGVGGAFRLADFDTLSLSNLNRLRASVKDLGVNKAVLSARQMLELDPYLDIQLFTDGITDENIEAFFTGGGKLDLLIEECDDFWAKVRVREVAKIHHIPVLMDTSDRGMLDIERFDREPERPLFHGAVEGLTSVQLRGISLPEKMKILFQIFDPSRISARLMQSLPEMKKSIEAWPQLGSAVTLGGAITTDAARRLLLGELTGSGRFYVDVDSIVRDAPAQAASGTVTLDEVRTIVRSGILAPSGGNAQPWRFVWMNGQLSAYLVPERTNSFLDFENRAGHLALGAAFENMDIMAKSLGLRVDAELFPAGDAQQVFRLSFTRDSAVQPEDLSRWIARRVTNRKLGKRTKLPAADVDALRQAAESRGGQLHLITQPEQMKRVGRILGRGDHFRLTDAKLHAEMMSEMRWTPAETNNTLDGIDLMTLELPAPMRRLFPLLGKWKVMEGFCRIGGGKMLEQPSQQAVKGAGAVGLITIAGEGADSYFNGGRAMERVWLTANARGYAFQPMTALNYIFARFLRSPQDFTEAQRIVLADLRKDFVALYPQAENAAEIMLFRLTKAGEPTARALRLPLEKVLTGA